MTTTAQRFLACLLPLLLMGAKAPEVRRKLAVLEVVPRESARKNPAYAEVPPLLTDALRQGAVGATEGYPYDVLTRDIMQGVLENMAGCAGDGEGGGCTLDLGKTLQADVVLGSELAVLDGQLILNMELYNVKEGNLLVSQRVLAPNSSALLEKVAVESVAMFKKGLLLRNFASGLDLRVPVVNTTANKRVALSNFNKAAEEGFARSSRLQDAAAARPEEKMEAWCSLAAIAENNRYLETARPACEGWKRYVDALTALRATLPDDYDKIAAVMGFAHIPATEKQALLEEFTETYAPLKDDGRVGMVAAAHTAFMAGKPVQLHSLSELEHAEARRREAALQAAQAQERAKEEAAQAERDADAASAQRGEAMGRVFSGETASQALRPGLRMLEAGAGTVLELAFLASIPFVLSAFGAGAWAGMTQFTDRLGLDPSTPEGLLLIGLIVGAVALIPIVVIAAGGGSVFLGPVKTLVFGWLMGGDISIRPITALLHPVLGCMVFPLWVCAPYAVVDYALGFGAVFVRAYKGQPAPSQDDITD